MIKTTLWLTIILFSCGVVAKAQAPCVVPPGFVCISQSDADNIKKDLDELKASRPVIAQFKAERITTDALLSANANLIKSLTDLNTALLKETVDQQTLIALQQKVAESLVALVEKLTNVINKPKSGWAKFTETVERIALVLVGVGVGRHL